MTDHGFNVDKIERRQWRGKVRVSSRTNAVGAVQFLGQYKVCWWSEWQAAPNDPEWIERDGWRVHNVTFDSLNAAKVAAKLKWEQENADRAEQMRTRFGTWRKIWP